MQNSQCDYWRKAKRTGTKKSGCTNSSTDVIDSIQGFEFTSKFEELYNPRVQYDKIEMERFVRDLNNRSRSTFYAR